ncbi:Regulator of V-ATPase in vacuolar membrane protein 1 [Wickerhamomyces ciferrii]|uniref:Regulator of V-ATPase in vacuolar membrane protein 1 n=1 Tax=Wickerhamomyces ciferrii (strain ATCC 14091 / BCRC 22168 / CBS 111 / JCM 3599 / NBRC 0793 / NRRL Y-1031 F-60-10) TaxID=1206466 RepID=K0KHP1_WICCF|nr:Regulator of V-ATPase in vacuolar membrane protein 1 [Wickerhamomyces ciferrii]CCH42531.1 Regulator of V-ATPase in vacuolar membrane protein 1 [Wickerhamomyces ciferrii]
MTLSFVPGDPNQAYQAWRLRTKLIDPNDHSPVNTLSWGVQEEIVIGSDFLTLWNLRKEYGETHTRILWSKLQANPVYIAKITQDSSLIASCGKYDKLLKVWNRVLFGDNSLFDMTYLMHPTTITNLRWKTHDYTNLPTSDSYTNTLYSLGRDSVLRIWSSYEYEKTHLIQHWGSLNLYNDSCKKEGKRFVNIVDDYLVTKALKSALSRMYSEQLIEIQKRQPDMAFVADENSNITVIAIENLSQNPPKLMSTAVLKTLKFYPKAFVSNPQFINFAETIINDEGDLSVIIHDLNGVIRHTSIDLRFLVDHADINQVGFLAHKLTGHKKSIKEIIRTVDGEAMLTRSRFTENAIWIPQHLKNGVTLAKKSIVNTPAPISKAVMLERGDILLTLCSDKLLLWNTSLKIAEIIGSFDINTQEEPLSFSSIPFKQHDHNKHYVAAIFKTHIKAWLVEGKSLIDIPAESPPFDADTIHIIAPIDPVGSKFESIRPILSTITKNGILQCYNSVIENGKLKWYESTRLETDILNASYIRGSSVNKFAIVDETRKKLTIWDLKTKVLEYEEVLESNVKDIDWTSTEGKQSMLAIGFDDYSLLYTQLRYDYTNKHPPFQVIKKIDVSKYTTHKIGDSIWLKDGTLVIGTGNQIFVSDKTLDVETDKFTKKSLGSRNIVSNDLLNLCSVLNGPLPLYHPQILIQTLFNKKIEIVKEILLRLFLKIRELEAKDKPINLLGSTLGFDISKFFDLEYHEESFEEPYTSFDDNVADLLKEKLTLHTLPYVTRHQQITLVSTIEAVQEIIKNSLSLDDNGLRFLLGMKLFQLHKGKQEKLTMRDINWAMHSENKELLLQLVETSVKDQRITWTVTKEYGLAYWLKYDDLVSTIEKVARNEFINDDKKDPIKCSVYYLALKKKQILIGLWRTSFGHPEQQKMMNFLKNDFKEKRWRTAALKNAFVLLSKHRYLLAACFFLLADSLKDSVNVLIKQVQDFDLALAVCRIYEGDNGPALQDLLKKNLLSNAISLGDRWTTSFIFWKLKQQSRSIQALVKSPIDCVSDDEKKEVVISERSKFFIEDDPLLLTLYQDLREKNLHYFHGSLGIKPEQEFEFITRVAAIYTRMGCDLLAVSLVKSWTFLKSEDFKKKQSYVSLKSALNGADSTPVKASAPGGSILEKYGLSPSARRRSSFIINYQDTKDQEEPEHFPKGHTKENGGVGLSILEKYGLASNSKSTEDEKSNGNDIKASKAPPPKAAFQEPDMSAFNFGF